MQDVPLDEMERFRTGLLEQLEEELPDLCRRIDLTGLLTEEDREELLAQSRKFLAQFQADEKQG